MTHRRVSPVLLLSVLLTGCGGGVESGVVELKFGHVGAPGSLYEVVANEFARRVNERLAGRAEMVVFGSSQLGSDDVLLQKLKLGTVDVALPSTVMSSTIDAFGLFEMPYLVQDRDHMRRLEQEIVWPDLAPLAEADGYRLLAVWENGFRHITNNERPIRTPEDLRGIKLRTPRGVWRVKLFQALGANPTPMPFSEVFIALQTGVMDGQENPLAQIVSAKLHEVQTYLSMSGHVYTPAFVTVGVNRWERLPVEVTSVVEEVAREMQPFVYENAIRLDEELLSELGEAGLEINEVDRRAFRAASQAIYDEFASTVEGGQILLDKALPVGDG
jgi:tripartite ATP-independent transporter DctP family solute receptor